MAQCDSQIPIVPVSGFLDLRGTPDSVPFGGYRRALNVAVTQKKRLCRASGWRRFRDQDAYINSDLHDQFAGAGETQNFILLHQAKTEAGFTRTFAATQNRIYMEVPAAGNWRVISDQLGGIPRGGCAEQFWAAASIGSVVIFSNNIDSPVYAVVDQGAEEDDQSVSKIPDLTRLNVSKAGVVVAWNNLMFLMDVEQDGSRFRNRIIWSDYRRPLSYYPNLGVSLAGGSDLPGGEIILNAEAIADVLLIYTTSGIWECRVSGTAAILTFRKRYVGDAAGSRCLAYKRTLVSTGDKHYYMGRDGIYRYSLYVPEPELVEFIHLASPAIYDDINTGACNAHCAGFFPKQRQIWFSWARNGETCPSRTLVVGTEFPFCSEFDEGFSAFLNCEPRVNIIIRDILRDFCVCTTAQLAEFGFLSDNEGATCRPQTDPECPARPQSFWTQNARNETDIDLSTEDFLQVTPDPDSFAGLFAETTIASLCDDEFLAGDCNANETFLMASTFDMCLKEAADVFYREHCTDKAGCGTYSRDGYKTDMISGALHFNAPEFLKLATGFQIEAHPEPATIPGEIKFFIGVAAQAIDPLTASGRCLILWEEQEEKRLECLSALTSSESIKEGTAPAETFAWPLHAPGKYIYYRILIENSRATPRDTGAAVCISRYDMTVRQLNKC